MQIIDCHTHILSAGSKIDNRIFLEDLCRGNFMARGMLPSNHIPTLADWDCCTWLFDPIRPENSIADHKKASINKVQLMTVAPSDYTPYGTSGSLDLAGIPDVRDEPSIDEANDYTASLMRIYPDDFIGFGAVNPRYHRRAGCCPLAWAYD